MKTSFLTILALGVASFLPTSTFAQTTWQTVDDYQTVPGKGAAVAGIAAVDNGVAFSACMVDDAAGQRHGVIRRSLDGGQSWLSVFDVPNTAFANCWNVTVGHSGLVFAAASARPPGGANANNWITLRSADGGTTWSIVDSYIPAGTTGSPYAVVEDSAGRVFVGGVISDAQGKQHFYVRRSLDGGTTWTTVDDVAGTATCSVWGLTATPAGVFSAGRISGTWGVRRSTDGGNTWATVDKYGAGNAYAYGLDSDANGNVYVTGSADITVTKATKTHWITRKSTDGGATWRTVDDVASGSFHCGRAVTVDAYGRVFVTGQILSGSTYHWVTRGSSDAGATWVTTDDYALSASGAMLPRGAASDGVGNVFIGGQANGTDGVAHAVVRKLAAP
jgi:hypothetical protein